MLRSHRHLNRRPPALVVAALALTALYLIPAAAKAAARRGRVVSYHGYRLTVPAGWPVYRLRARSTRCVRFDRHAVYLGAPGADQRCPATTAVGRTEAILVQPQRGATAPLPFAGRDGATAAHMLDARHRVALTVTWDRRPSVVARALGLPSLHALRRRSSPVRRGSAVMRANVIRRSYARRHTTTGPALPGQVYTGPGFDACHTPSTAQMSAWQSSPYAAIGVYIGGENMACSQPNLTAAWVSQESAAGWHLIPIYVGLQAPTNSCCQEMSSTPATAAQQGAADAATAVTDAQAIGIGPGNPLYLDMEAYSRNSTNTPAVLAYLSGWTNQLHADGYASGVYVADYSGVPDLVSQQGTGYPEPDDLWFAAWNSQATTSDPELPPQYWAAHQRLHQYQGGHNETYSGTTINIDNDYLDSATAAAGSGSGTYIAPTPAPSPSLSLSTGPDGTVTASPSWQYQTGVSSWQLMGGQSPSSLTPIGGPTSTTPLTTNNAYPYFAVSGVAANGQILGSSAPVTTPAHVAIFGGSVFVPHHGLAGVPIGCFGSQPCHLATTVALGHSLMARTGSENARSGRDGLVYFSLNRRDHALVARDRHLQVRITVRDASGLVAARTLTLQSFSTTSPGPRRHVQSWGRLRFIGAGDFVSHGWVGGILAACYDGTFCQARTKITYGRRVIARTGTEALGVNQAGYLMFKLTRGGHNLLRQAAGNQLPVTVTTTTSDGARATGRIVLSAY